MKEGGKEGKRERRAEVGRRGTEEVLVCLGGPVCLCVRLVATERVGRI